MNASRGQKGKEIRVKKVFIMLLAAGMIWVMLSGCGASEMEFDSAQEAKEALNTASEIEIFADLDTKSRKTDILADGKVAGTLRGSTVYVDGEEWFHMDYVTDHPINNREGVSSSTTYGFYDSENNCLGYAQLRYMDTADGERDVYLVYMDADGTEADYYASSGGDKLYNGEGTVIGTGYADKKGVGFLEKTYTNIYLTTFSTEPEAKDDIDFMFRMGMFKCLQKDIQLVYDEVVSTPVQIFETVAVVLVIVLWVGGTIASKKRK